MKKYITIALAGAVGALVVEFILKQGNIGNTD